MNPESPTLHPWQKYMPSKKIQLLIGVLIIVGVVYGLRNPIITLFKKIKETPGVVPVTTVPQPILEQNSVTLSIEKDTDGDGILDWQETLLGTDPLTPNSKSEVPQEIRQLVENSETLVDTSDKLALRVYQRLKTEPKGENIAEAIQAATSKEMLDYADSIDQGLTTYSVDDLNLVDNGTDVETSYRNQIFSTLESIKLEGATLNEVYRKILTNDSSIKNGSYELKLSKTITALLAMPVPLRYSDIHLQTLNAVTHMDRILSAPIVRTDDPTSQYASLLVFQKNMNVLIQSGQALAIMFGM